VREVKGTKVLAVQKRDLSFWRGRVEISPENGENTGGNRGIYGEDGENVNRIVRGICVAAICVAVVGGGGLLAQGSSKKSGESTTVAVARGKSLFQQKCAVCHYDNSEQKKIGPGLKGISKRGTFSVNGNKLTDDSLKSWIENGDRFMPSFKEVLEPTQIKDVIAYVKIL